MLGLALGPPGIAAGLVSGGIIGGVIQAEDVARPVGELFDEVRAAVPEGHSAILAYAPVADIDEMIEAFGGARRGRQAPYARARRGAGAA